VPCPDAVRAAIHDGIDDTGAVNGIQWCSEWHPVVQ